MLQSKIDHLRRSGIPVHTKDKWFDADSHNGMSLVLQIQLRLSKMLRSKRKSKKLTQKALGERMGFDAKHIRKLENTGMVCDADATIDQLIHALVTVGVTPRQIGDKIAETSN